MAATAGTRSLVEDARVAVAAAARAATVLLGLRADAAAGAESADDLRKRGDRLSHDALLAALSADRPGDWILSEEAADDPGRTKRDRVWIIDPLDGTREFGEPGRTDWAVHVALVRDGDLAVGVVALPALGQTLTSADPPVVPARSGRLRMVVSRTRPPDIAAAVAARMQAELIPMGSAGAKAMAVATGAADMYVHAGGQHEWDSAAPVAVARAAGLHVSRLDGSPLLYNRYPAWQPDLVVCRPELSRALMEALRAAGG